MRQVYCVQHHRDASQPRGIRVELAAVQLEEPDTDIHNGIIFLGAVPRCPAVLLHITGGSLCLHPGARLARNGVSQDRLQQPVGA